MDARGLLEGGVVGEGAWVGVWDPRTGEVFGLGLGGDDFGLVLVEGPAVGVEGHNGHGEGCGGEVFGYG